MYMYIYIYCRLSTHLSRRVVNLCALILLIGVQTESPEQVCRRGEGGDGIVRHDAGIRPDRELAESLPRVCEEDPGKTDPENPTGKLGSSAGYLHGCAMLCVWDRV
jgi:hypothetical protein